jgi:hypothetical protein
MDAVREAWTDERLDDLSNRMDRGFDRVDTDLRELRTEMNSRFGLVDARFDSMHRMIIATLVAVVVGFVSVLGAVLATNL